jgi:hypothetical protein
MNCIYLILYILLIVFIIVVYAFNIYYLFDHKQYKITNTSSVTSNISPSVKSSTQSTSSQSSDSALVPVVTIEKVSKPIPTLIPATTPSQIGKLTEVEITPMLKTMTPDLVASISNNTINSLLISEKLTPNIIKSLTISQLLYMSNGNFKQLYRKNVTPYLSDLQNKN